MSPDSRAPGWYPDPWGTDDERYFDGVAWARTTRGQSEAPPLAPPTGAPLGPEVAPAPPPAVTPPPVAGSPVVAPPGPTPAPPAPAAPTTTPPGWYADPWRLAPLRYWDGSEWTGHVSGPAMAAHAGPRLDDERTAGRWARVGLAWGGPALAISTVAGAFQWSWIAEHWDELTTRGNDVQQSGNNGAAIAGQLSGLVLLVVGVLFLLWFHRAASNAASAGYPARRSPGWATASFIIPIVNFWWPYQSTCDLLPADHPARVSVRRWWALWIGCTIAGFATIAAALSQNDIALGLVTGVGAALALLAAMAARTVVTEIGDAHRELLARAPAGI